MFKTTGETFAQKNAKLRRELSAYNLAKEGRKELVDISTEHDYHRFKNAIKAESISADTAKVDIPNESDKKIAGWLNDGRGPVRPVNKKALLFKIKGKRIFSKFAKATNPNYWWSGAGYRIDLRVNNFIETVSKKIFGN